MGGALPRRPPRRAALTAVLLALAGACAFAVSTVVQHRSATAAVTGGDRRWLLRLARRPAWLAAQAAGAVGVLLHAAALRSGPVALVQPLLAAGLVVALVLGAWVDRRHPDRRASRRQWLAAAAVAAGLAVFLLAARPSPGRPVADPPGPAAVTVGALVLGGLAAWWTRRPARRGRALVLGVATGTGFAVTGLLLKQLTGLSVPSWSAAATALELGVVAVMAIATSQAAFAAGPLVDSLPVIAVLEPGVGVLLAGPLFGEGLVPGGGARLGQLAGALVLGGGLALLVRHTSAALPRPADSGCSRRSGEPRTVGARGR